MKKYNILILLLPILFVFGIGCQPETTTTTSTTTTIDYSISTNEAILIQKLKDSKVYSEELINSKTDNRSIFTYDYSDSTKLKIKFSIDEVNDRDPYFIKVVENYTTDFKFPAGCAVTSFDSTLAFPENPQKIERYQFWVPQDGNSPDLIASENITIYDANNNYLRYYELFLR